jgi:hypothetical protein
MYGLSDFYAVREVSVTQYAEKAKRADQIIMSDMADSGWLMID